MSRIGKKQIVVPAGVEVSVSDATVSVKGPKGQLSIEVAAGISVIPGDGVVDVVRASDERRHRALHGLTRSLVANMVTGTSVGFEKRLEIHGVGYRAQSAGAGRIELALGFSHPVFVDAPEGIVFEVPAQNQIVVRGIDRQAVGQVAANIRKIRKPEPYKGKGVRYLGEHVARKARKAAK